MRSFLGKIKTFEKMDHFARARRILEMQQAQDAKVDPAQHQHVTERKFNLDQILNKTLLNTAEASGPHRPEREHFLHVVMDTRSVF